MKLIIQFFESIAHSFTEFTEEENDSKRPKHFAEQNY